MTSPQPDGHTPRPSIELFAPKELTTAQHTWGREILVCEMPQFIGKILLMNAGAACSITATRWKHSFLMRGRRLSITTLEMASSRGW